MTGFVASGSLAVLLHHLEEILTLLFILCQFQVKLLRLISATPRSANSLVTHRCVTFYAAET